MSKHVNLVYERITSYVYTYLFVVRSKMHKYILPISLAYKKYLGRKSLLINRKAGIIPSILINTGQNIRLPMRNTGIRGITRLLFFNRQHTQENAVTIHMYLIEYIASSDGVYALCDMSSASSLHNVNKTAGSSGYNIQLSMQNERGRGAKSPFSRSISHAMLPVNAESMIRIDRSPRNGNVTVASVSVFWFREILLAVRISRWKVSPPAQYASYDRYMKLPRSEAVLSSIPSMCIYLSSTS